nr:ribonuclease H-like domain-containing protein [Tanacetum cinerariifolium]
MSPRSCLRWKPMGKIFKTVGLRWVPTGRILTSSITKVDSERLNSSNADITNQYECEQTLDVSACTYNLSAVRNPDFKYRKVFLQRKLILSKRISTILGLELFFQDIQSFKLKEKNSNRRDLPKDTPYLEIAVLRYDGDECDKGRMPSKIELTLEQSQQGVSNGVLVSVEVVEELKRNVWIKGVKKEALHYMKMEILLEPTSNKLLVEEVPTASEESSHCQKKREATAVKIALLLKSRRNCQSKSDDSYTKLVPHVTPSEGSKTLEQTFNGLQVIVSQLHFMDVEIEQGDLNKKFLTSLAPEWLMHTIVWRNRSDLDTMSLDDMYNHLKDINQIDEDDMEEMDIKWNIALLSMRADRFWKKTRKKISIQGLDVAGFDKSKSYMANDEENHALVAKKEAPTEFALMANTSAESKVLDNSLCSKDYKKNTDSLNTSKDLDSLLESQRLDKNKEGLGYNVVPPLPAQIYSSPKKDMSWTGLSKFKDDTVTDYGRPAHTVESSLDDAQNKNPSVTEEASPSTILPKSFIKFVKANYSPNDSKIGKAETAKKPPVKYAEQYRKPTKKPNVRGNQRNWNNLKSHQLGPNFVMKKNACFNCGDFNHFAYDCRKRVKKETSRSQNTTHKSFTPRPALHNPYRPPMRPMRSNMNGARPNRTSFNKPAHSYTSRPFQRTSAVRSQYRAPWVPTVNRKFPPVNRKFSTVSKKISTVNRKFPTANRKFPTGGIKFSTADMGKKGKAGSSQNYIDDKGYWDSGCSRHMTGNISYLYDYEPFDEGYVSFGQGGCKITGKGTIKTGKLKFENVYFMKDLKYNLFSVSQIYDNKNSVLFTNSESIVLGRNFKLSDDDNVLLRTPRQHNMYSIDLNTIVPHKDLTCLVTKASRDECML